MNRRHLFSLLPAAALGAAATRAVAKPIPATAKTKGGLAISVQCWSFNRFTLFEALEMAGASGAGVVEIFPSQKIGGPLGEAKVGPDLPDDAIQAILDQAAKCGVTPVNFGVTEIPKDEAGARKVFDFARKLGLYGITTESIEAIDTIEKLCQEYDIVVGFHNHPKKADNPGYRMWDPEYVFAAVESLDPRVGICADVGHWATSSLDPAAVVQKVAPRIVSFHLKDRAIITGHSHDRPFGTGILDLPGMLDAATDKGFAGNVSIEYEYNWEKSLPDIAQCVGYLRAWSNLRS